MGDVTGFLKHDRVDFKKEDAKSRTSHWNEFSEKPGVDVLKDQAARCMDCGVPFCHTGCPINNYIPDWNDLVYNNKWEDAAKRLLQTNNFPEFTGRVCPAPCENSCVLAINKPAVTIKNVEVSIIEKAFEEGWIKANPPKIRSGFNVAVVGSGPAGLSAADQLNKAGHSVTVYEKNEFIGGLLTLGIPNFKMEKSVVERRVNLMKEEGIEFKTGVNVGVDVSAERLKENFDAIILSGGAEWPRDIPVEGRDLDGIHFAMDFLSQQNRRNLNGKVTAKEISAKDKDVIVLGGGDTGSDCIGTSIRQGAKSVRNFELLPQPPKERNPNNPWPQWALVERISTSHEEGCQRDFSILTKKFSGTNGKVEKLHGVKIVFGDPDPQTGRRPMNEVAGTEFEIKADLVLLALGFLGPVKNGLLESFGVELTDRGNVKTDDQRQTTVPGVFAAGDMRRGQSLVVWAINEGRTTAEHVHNYLNKKSIKKAV